MQYTKQNIIIFFYQTKFLSSTHVPLPCLIILRFDINHQNVLWCFKSLFIAITFAENVYRLNTSEVIMAYRMIHTLYYSNAPRYGKMDPYFRCHFVLIINYFRHHLTIFSLVKNFLFEIMFYLWHKHLYVFIIYGILDKCYTSKLC